MSDQLLHVKDLRVSYGAIRAIHGVTFEVKKGQVVSLIGANGAGKSTILNTISGLLKPESGAIHFDGKDITGWRPENVSASGLAQVPEGRLVIATMTVMENLMMGAYRRHDNEIQHDLESIFESFPRLKERTHQRAGLLSGGEQQMLAVGRAMMARPQLMMLDEPSMGLAPLLVNEVFRIIAAINEQGATVLLVEQNARKALQIADYAYVLDRGQIAHEGEARQLRTDPRVIEAYLGEG